MKNAYNSNSYDDFFRGKDEYQSQRKMNDVSMKDELGAPKEMPTEDFRENPSWAKKAIAKMKYAPKTASFSEFTKAKKGLQSQGAATGHNRDESTKLRMEDLGVEDLPKHKGDKSFDIDVTKYKTRKASLSTLKTPTK